MEVTRDVHVTVKGVADETKIVAVADYKTSEAEVDFFVGLVDLTNIVKSVVSDDKDGSEKVTLRITGLPKDFSIEGAVLISRGDPNGDGTDRVWSIPSDLLGQVQIKVPQNYSGKVEFVVAGVTTENDGDSKTSSIQDVSFTITPSPEATITENVTLREDIISKLDLKVVHQNGDDNEELGDVYIPVDYATGEVTLYLGETELSDAGLETKTIGEGTYYVIPSDKVAELGAKGPLHKDGKLKDLEFKYDVIDPSNDGKVASETTTKDGKLKITVTPETDEVTAQLKGIVVKPDIGSTSDDNPDTVILTKRGSFVVNFHVASADNDGSEHVVRVLVEDVPQGVSVVGGSQIADGKWMLVFEGEDALKIGTDGVNIPVEFEVGFGVPHEEEFDISMSAMVQDLGQDRGQDASSPALIEQDTVKWKLKTDMIPGAQYIEPKIDDWSYNGVKGSEDTSFTLKDVMTASVTAGHEDYDHTYTVSITGLPAGTQVEGMVYTVLNGVPTWTATVLVKKHADNQEALDALLDKIKITPPLNSNENNAEFKFDARLTAAVVGGRSVEEAISVELPVTPVTDEVKVDVEVSDASVGETSITATISAESMIDGKHGVIVDGKLYVQMSFEGTGNEGGTLTAAGETLELQDVKDVKGIEDGQYYIVNVGESGGSVELVYQLDEGKVLQPGEVNFKSWAQTKEKGAENTETGWATGTVKIAVINNGVTVESKAVKGKEAVSSDKSQAIELNISVELNDKGGTEAIRSIALTGVPEGFLVYIGDNAEDAILAENGGGNGTLNDWIVSKDSNLPDYIAILPPPHWSGTLDDLKLVVSSGENSLKEPLVETEKLASVTINATADGLSMDPTLSVGREGQIIALNLGAVMVDVGTENADGETVQSETTTLEISGLGEYASFYVGTDLYENVTYNEDSGTYTIKGLSQDDLNNLGFKQAAGALEDQDKGKAGTQITIDGWTTVKGDGSIVSSKTGPTSVTVDVNPSYTSTDPDDLLWNGERINGRAGDDTVHLRYGESLSGKDLAEKLNNIEVLDLGIGGANAITDLTAEQVQKITDDRNHLTIRGSKEDSVTLSGNWKDNGDGSFTTTIGGKEIKLTLDGVENKTGGEAAAPASFSMASFGMFDEPGGFGLASLDGHENAQQSEEKAGPITIDDVLSADTDSDDLIALLPEEKNEQSASSFDAGRGQPNFADVSSSDMMSSLEDELMRSPHYEV